MVNGSKDPEVKLSQRMKFLPKPGGDLVKMLKVRLWLAPFFGAGCKVVIKTSRYTDYQDLQILPADNSRRMRDILWKIDHIALPSPDDLTASIHLQLT